MSYLVNGKDGAVLMTGDACDLKFNFDLCVGPGIGSHDSGEAQRSLERLNALVTQFPQIKVYFGHEIPGRRLLQASAGC